MVQKLLFISVFLLGSICVKAQFLLNKDPEKFVADVNAMMAANKGEAAIKAGNNFASVWNSFDESQKKKIMETSQKMVKSKKLRTNPHFYSFFASLYELKNKGIPAPQVDSLLYMTDKAVEKYSGKAINDYFTIVRTFLESGILYKSPVSALYAKGGAFSFKFIEAKIAPEVDINVGLSVPEKTNSDSLTSQNLDKKKADFFSDWDTPQKAADDWGTIPNTPADTTPVQENVLDVGYTAPLQPTLEGAIITFENIDLLFTTPGDSGVLKGTSGSLMLKNGIFVGKGGKFDWSSVGIEDAVCEFKEYNFETKNPKVTAEGATLTYPTKTDKPVDGVFEYVSRKHKNNNEAQYPRFKSFVSNVNLKGLGDNFTYHGGLSLAGTKVYSSSIDEGAATIEILRDGKTQVKTQSNRFELGDSLILAGISNVVIYTHDSSSTALDSITHPGVILKFNKKQSLLRLSKHPDFKSAPYIDSYHKLDIVADALIWDLDSTMLDFTILNAKDQIPATFESSEFFQGDKYAMIQGIYRFHPLQVIVNYAGKKKVTEFYPDDVAKETKLDPLTIRGAMVSLMKGGFIDYNPKSGLIRLRPKARHYVLSRMNKKDYDNINFISISPAVANASLNLKNNQLNVRGVSQVFISDSLSVNFEPKSKEIKILKNRDFEFDGIINTESAQFKGSKFHFNYDSFLVHLPTIDEIKLKTKSKNKEAKKDSKFKAKVGDKTQEVQNSLSNSSGILYINKPNNKSARKKLDQYPIFAATNGASVYFTQDSASKALFDSTISFKIPPFVMDSLSGKDATKQGFKGKFSSGGIFPDFDEKLVVMKDLSLGFEHFVPDAGYPLYKGKGTYHTKIILDKQGLQGNGEIHYLNTTLRSEKFMFFRDSVTTTGFESTTKPGVSPDAAPDVTFPDMVVKEYKLLWLPKSDSMFITATKDPIQLYNNTATLQGTANITKNGTLGKGILLTRGSESESKKFQFEKTHFEGRNARFQVNTANPAKPALLVKDAKLAFDLEKNIATFGPEVAGFASTEFPYAQYKSSLDMGKWDLKGQKVTMTTHEGGDIERSYFYSTHPEQDSLVFNAKEAVYDMVKSNLTITGVPFIRVADAMIIPDSNKVYIEENAVIPTLVKAKLIVDTLDQFHKLYDGAIDIKSKKRFEGVATYQYVNLGADTLAIKFQEFSLKEPERKKDPGPFTVATGTVKEEDNFVIGPKILYKGKVTMYANNKNLYFDGYLKLDLKGELQKSSWLRYVNDGDSSLVISLENSTADNGNPLITGLHFGNKTNELYTTFISEKKDPLDADLFLASGMLEYYPDKNEFGVASKEKIIGKSYAGNILKYNDTKSTINYQGKFNLLQPNKNFDFYTVGEGFTDLKYNSYDFNTMIVLNSKVHASVISSIGKSLRLESEYLIDSSTAEQVQGRERRLPFQLGEILGNSAAEKFVSGGGGNFLVGIPEMAKGIVLSDVNLKWSSEHKSYYSVGKIYVSNIGKEEINKPMNGYIELKKSTQGDEFHIYLEPVANSWYYITYEDNRLAFVTSNDAINSTIQSKYKTEPADHSKFYIARGDVLEEEKFLDYFKEFYIGGRDKPKPSVQKETKPVVKKADTQIPISAEPISKENEDKKGKKKEKKKNETSEPKSLEDIEKTADEKPAINETAPTNEPAVEEPKEESKIETPEQDQSDVGEHVEEPEPADGKKSKKGKSKKKEKQSALETDTEESGQ